MDYFVRLKRVVDAARHFKLRLPRRMGRTVELAVRRLLVGVAIASAATAGLPLEVRAAPYYWDTDGSTVGNDVDGDGLGGTGVWDTSTANWWDLSNLVLWPNSFDDMAIFTGTPGTVTVNTGILANGLSFRAGGYRLTGGDLTLGGLSPTMHVTLGNTATIDSLLSGTAGFTKTGGGALRLNNALNNYTGTTSVNNGLLIIGNVGALGTDTSAIVVNGSATRGFGGGALLLEGGYGSGLNLTRDLILQGAGPINTGAALISVGDNTLSGAVSTNVGAVNTTLASTYGMLTINNLTTAGTAATTFTIFGVTGNTGSYTLNGTLSGAGSISKAGGGTLILAPTDASTFSGTIRTNSGGSIRVSSPSALGVNAGTTTSSVLDLNGGTLEFRTDTPNFNRNVYARATSTVFADHDLGSNLINQTVTLNTLRLPVNVTLTLASRNGYGITFNGNFTTEGSTSTSGQTATITNNLTGLLTFQGTAWNNTDTSAANRTLAIGGTGNTLIMGNVLASGGGTKSLSKSGTGTLTLMGAASTYQGNTNIQGGTLAIAHFGSINNNSANIHIGSTTTAATLSIIGDNLTVAQATTDKVVNLLGTTGGATILANQTGTSPGVVFNADFTATGAGIKTLTLGGSNALDNTILGAIVNNSGTNTTALTKIGSGTWVLAGTNTYTGNTTISDGLLKIRANAGTSTIIDDASSIIFNATSGFAGGRLEFVGQVDGNNLETLGTLTPTQGANTIVLSPGSGGTASLLFNNMGTVGGGATVNFVAPTANDTFNFAAGVTGGNIHNAGLYYNGANFAFVDAGLFLRAAVYGDGLGGGGSDADFVTSATALTSAMSNQITGSFSNGAVTIDSLRIVGDQTLNMTGLLTVRTAGATNATGGILQTGGSGVISGTGVSTGGSGALVIRVNESSNTLTLNAPITSTTTGGFNKSGAGTLIIGAVNAQTGTTTINEGTVQLATGGRLSANNAAFVIRQGATFDLNGVSTLQTATAGSIGSFNGAGIITNTSAQAVVLAVGSGTTAGTGTFSGSINETVGGGRISVIKLGTTNAQTWNGISNYTGSTTIGVAGTATTGGLTVTTLADIGVDSSIGRGDATDTATNAASLVFAGTTGGLTYTGTTTVSTDRLFTLAGTGATITNNSANNQALIFSNTNAIAFGVVGPQLLQLGGTSTSDNFFNPQITDSGTGANVTSVSKIGTGLWILGNTNNTYSGVTTIVDGVLQAQDGQGLSSASGLLLGSTTTSGVFQSSGAFTRDLSTAALAGANTVSWNGTTGGGGFAASTDKLVVAIGGLVSPTALQWGSGGFVGTGGAQALIFSSTTALSEVEFRNAIDLNGAVRTITVNDNTSTFTDFATITGVLSNSSATPAGLVKNGAGLLQLFGDNTYDGATAVTAGTLVVKSLGLSTDPATGTSVGANVGANLATGAVTLGNAGTTAGILQYVGAGETSDRMIRLNTTTGNTQIIADGSGALVLTNVQNDMAAGAKTLSLRGSNTQGNMIASVLGDNGGALAITADTGATWILTGENTYSGETAITAGALGAGHNSAFGTGVVRINNGSLFAYGGDRVLTNNFIQNNTTTAVTATIIGDENLTLNGATWTHTNTSVGHTLTNSIAAGKLLTINNQMTFNAITAARTLTVNGSGDTLINGIISTSTAFGVNITYSGTGSLTLTNTASGLNAGAITVSNGRLKIGAANLLQTINAGNVAINPGAGNAATLDLNGFSDTIRGLTATTAGTAVIDNTSASAATLTFGDNDQAVNFLPTIGTATGSIGNSGGGALSIFKVGTAAAVIGNSTLTYTGSTSVSGGSLTINADSDLAGTTGLSVTSGATLNILGGFSASTSVTSVTVGDASHLNLLNGSGDPLSNLTSLTLGNNAILSLNVGATSNTLTLTGAATATGLVTLNISNTGSMLGNTTYDLLVASGGGLTAGGGNYALGFIPGGFSSLTLNQADTLVSLTTGNLIVDPIYWTGASNTAWNTVDGSFNGLNWSSDKAGTVQSTFVPGAGSTVVFQANSAVGGVLTTTLEQNFFINNLEFESSTNTPTSVAIEPGGFAAATLSINPSNTSIADGINLKTGGPASVSISSRVGVASEQTWTVTDSSQVLSVSGALTGNGVLHKAGAGRLILSGTVDNTFAVPTVNVNGGELQITNIAALGTTALGNLATINVNAGGMFYYNAAAATTANTINLNGGTLSAGGGTQTYSSTVNVLANSTISMLDPVTLANGRSMTLSGGLSGTGDLTVDGITTVTSGNQITGTLTLNQDNSAWTGNWNILRGSVSTNNANGLGSGSTITMEKGRFLFTAGAGTPTVTQDIIIASATENAVGEFNLADGIATTFTGQITLGGVGGTGEFRLTSANDAATGSITGGIVLANDGLIGVINAATRLLHVDSVISETGGPRSLRINDAAFGSTAGTVRLSGANTFTGNVTVNRGTLEFATVTNAGGAASNLGQGNTITLGAAQLRFIGNADQATDRAISTTGSATLGANGVGASITYNGAITQGADQSLTLTGTGNGIINGGISQPAGGATADLTVTGGNWTIQTGNVAIADDFLLNAGTVTLQNMVFTLNDDVIVTGSTSVLNLNTTGVLNAANPAGTSSGLYTRNGGVINLNAHDINGVANANGLDFVMVGDTTVGAVATLNTNTFNITTPRLDLGGIADGLEGLILGSGTITGTFTGTDYASGFRLFRGSIAANLAGGTTILKQGLGTVVLSGDNSGLTGAVAAATRVDAGILRLDYTVHNTNKLTSARGLDMRGATIEIIGNDSADTVQSVQSLTLASGGANVITVLNGSGQSATLNLGAITRAASVGTLRLNLSTSGAVTSTTANDAIHGLLGLSAYATVNNPSGTWFAANDGSNNIVGLVSTVKNDVASWANGDHVTDDSTGYTGVVNATALNSLRFNAATGAAVNIASNSVLATRSGGILITDQVAGGTPGILGGTLATGVTEFIITHDGLQTFEISSDLRLNNALTKTGAGTLRLSGNNVFTGQVQLQQGVLQLAGGNAIGDTSLVTLADDRPTTLQLLANETIGRLAGGSTTNGLRNLAVVDVGSYTLTTNTTGGNTTFSGLFVGDGTIVKNGFGTNTNWNLNNSSTGFTGTVVINGGLFQLSNIGRIDASAFVINKNGSLLIDNNGTTTVGTRILDTATITLNSADGAWSGETRPSGLTIRRDQGSTLNETVGAIYVNSGASYARLDATATSAVAAIIADDIQRANSATLNVRGGNMGATSNRRAQLRIGTTANQTAFIANNLVGGGGAAGTTTISIVPWVLAEDVGNAAVGDTNMGNSLATYVSGTGFRALNLSTEYATYAAAGATANTREALTADLTGLSGKTINSLVLHNATATTGAFNVLGSGAGQALVITSGAMLFSLNPTATASSVNGITLGGFDDGISTGGSEYVIFVQNPSSVAATPTLVATINSALSSVADITKSGRGTLVLTGTNTAGGGSRKTTINEGTLEIASLSNIGGATGDLVFAGGTLRLASAVDISARNVTFLQGGGTLDTNGNDVILAGSLGSGVGGFTKTGAGELWLSAAAAYTGDTNILGGSIVLFANNAIGSGNLNIGAGATLDLGGSSINVGLVTTSGASPIISSAGTINASAGYVFNHTGNTQIDADLNGAGGLLKQQSNVLTLTGAGNYAGLTEIQAGTLIINSIANVGAGPSALGNPLNDQDGVIRMGLTTGATTLTYDGSGHASDRLIGMQGTTGGVTLNANGTGAVEYGGVVGFTPGAKTLTIQGTAAGALVNTLGVVNDGVGTIAVTKAGTNTWHLANVGTFSGLVTVNGGVLSFDSIGNIGENSALGTGVNAAGAAGRISIGTTTTGATIRYTGAGHSSDRPVNLAGTTGGATIEASGTGALVFTGNFTATGNGVKTLTLTGANSLYNTIGGNIVNSTSATNVLKNGAGTWLLDGDKSYTGTTTIQEGVLAVTTLRNVGAGNSSLGNPLLANSTIAIGSAALEGALRYVGTELGGHATDRVIDLAGATGGAVLDASGVGALSFTSAFTATGAGSKTLTLTGSNTGANTISGDIVNNSGLNTTSLVKEGAGTWVLQGNKSYTGTTTINAGTLVINGTVATNVTINDGGRLAGNSTLDYVTINSGGVLAPGNSVGTKTLENAEVNGGAKFEWELAAATGTPGVHWDLVTVDSTLVLNASVGNPIVIQVLPLANAADNGLTNPGLIAGFNPASSYMYENGWLFAQANSITGFDASHFVFDAGIFRTVAGYEAIANESFSVYQGVGGLYVNYNFVAVPEPGSLLLVGLGGLGLAGYGWRKRKSKVTAETPVES